MNKCWEIFCREYLIDFNASRAYREAYPAATNKTAGANGNKLLQKTEIQSMLTEAIGKRLERLDIKADQVLRLLWDTATADPNELVEVRRDACRHCHGADHRYQFTPAEWERELKAFMSALELYERDGRKGSPPVLDMLGGVGYDPKRGPVEDCPECFGEGITRIIVKDTRTLSPAAKRLYAGAKRTQNGLEILTHSRDKNLELVGKHLGLFLDRVDHSGQLSVVTLKDDDADL